MASSRRVLAFIATASVLALGASACTSKSHSPTTGTQSTASGSSSTSGAAAPSGGGSSSATAATSQPAANFVDNATLTEAIGSDPGALDPDQSVVSAEVTFSALVYDYLGGIDADGNIVPSIATSYTAQPTSAVFTIRPGVTCSDGTPLSPQVIASNFQYVLDPKNKSPLLGVLLPPDATATSDATTVTLKTTQPDAYLAIGAVQIPLICQAGITDRTKLQRGAIGSGPFVLQEAVPDDHYTLAVRKDYAWGPNGAKTDVPGFPSRVTLKVVKDETTQANLLLSGQVQIASLAGPDRARLNSQSSLKKTDLDASVLSLLTNQAAGHPSKDPVVRKALLTAVNVDDFGGVTLDHRGVKPVGVTIPPSQCLDPTVQAAAPAMDATGAKASLDADGWKAGSDEVRTKAGKRLTITLIYPTSLGPTAAAGAELLAQELKAIGADVKISPQTDTAYSQTLFGTGNWDVVMLVLGLTSPSLAVPFFGGAAPPNGENFAGIKNTQFDTLAAQAVATPGSAGCTSWVNAEKALLSASDVLTVAGITTTIYAHKAQFSLDYSVGIAPTSLRVTK